MQHTKMNQKTNAELPNPGGKEAIAQGCECPVRDNNHGAGVGTDTGGKPLFWYSSDCVVHAEVVND